MESSIKRVLSPYQDLSQYEKPVIPTRSASFAANQTAAETPTETPTPTASTNAGSTPLVIPSTVVDNPPASLEIDPPETGTDVANTAVGYADSYYNETKTAVEAAQKQVDAGNSNLKGLYDALGMRGTDQLNAENAAGIPGKQEQLNRYLSNIRFGVDEMANARDSHTLNIDTEMARQGQLGGTKYGFSAREQQMNRDFNNQQASRAIALRTEIATADLLQGNVANAQKQVDAAIGAKYAMVEKRLEYEKFILEKNYDSLSDTQKTQADARMNMLQEQQRELTDARDAVNTAVASGGMQPSEVQKIMGMKPQDQMAYANVIIGRTAASDRQRKMALDDAQLANIYSQMNDRQAAKTETSAKEEAGIRSAKKTVDNSLAKVNDVMRMIANNTGFSSAVGAGFTKTLGHFIPFYEGAALEGSDRASFEGRIKTMKAALALPELEALRGLGAMSDREFGTVSEAVGALDPAMSEDEFKKTMMVISTTLPLSQAKAQAKVDSLDGKLTVPVVSADGKVGVVPAEELNQALQEGYTVIE